MLRFRFIGRNGGLTAATNATPTLTAWRTPLVVTDANTGDLTLGSLTYTSSTGVLSGGTAFTSRGISLDIANNLAWPPLLGNETVEIAQRDPVGNISLDLTAAQAVTAMGDVLANTTTGLGLTHGTTAGNIVVLHAPKVQRINPAVEDLKPLRADGRQAVDAGRVAAVAAVSRRILCGVRVKQRLVVGGGKEVIRPLIFRSEPGIALGGFVIREVGHGVVAENGRALLVFEHENFSGRRWIGQGRARQGEQCEETEQVVFHGWVFGWFGFALCRA